MTGSHSARREHLSLSSSPTKAPCSLPTTRLYKPIDWDTAKPEDLGDEHVVVLDGVHSVMFGSPNDEALHGHPLADRGLGAYAAHEVVSSSWIRGLERMNRAHSVHSAAACARLRHFILTFHDSTFECVCSHRPDVAVTTGVAPKDAAAAACERMATDEATAALSFSVRFADPRGRMKSSRLQVASVMSATFAVRPQRGAMQCPVRLLAAPVIAPDARRAYAVACGLPDHSAGGPRIRPPVASPPAVAPRRSPRRSRRAAARSVWLEALEHRAHRPHVSGFPVAFE